MIESKRFVRKTRVLKDPVIRKQEILDTAMQLFNEHGYEATSMRMIAQAMHVATGLCYRYFDSKQKLFEEAMEQYVKVCCQQYVAIMQERSKSLEERLHLMYQAMLQKNQYAKYHDFFHRPENRGLHEQLSYKICKYMYTYILEEMQFYNEKAERKIKNPEMLLDFILYGQLGLLSQNSASIDCTLAKIKEYIEILLTSQMTSE